jgi:hypothetical protein
MTLRTRWAVGLFLVTMLVIAGATVAVHWFMRPFVFGFGG